VLTVYGAECINGQVGIWTEFVEGRTLEALVHERGTLNPAEVIDIGINLCRALAAVHEAGLLHRDIKAQNVMRETGGRIVLMDFGAGHDLVLAPVRDGDLTGTPLYPAPELFAGGQPSHATDIYSASRPPLPLSGTIRSPAAH
jgi:serine/threonine-protein kinase